MILTKLNCSDINPPTTTTTTLNHQTLRDNNLTEPEIFTFIITEGMFGSYEGEIDLLKPIFSYSLTCIEVYFSLVS